MHAVLCRDRYTLEDLIGGERHFFSIGTSQGIREDLELVGEAPGHVLIFAVKRIGACLALGGRPMLTRAIHTDQLADSHNLLIRLWRKSIARACRTVALM